MASTNENLFETAMARYQSGAEASELIEDFKTITATTPNQAAGWTCLAWLQLLNAQPDEMRPCAARALR